MPRRRASALGVLLAVVALLLTGCGGSSGRHRAAPTAQQLLRQAKQKLDSTQAVHFALSSQNVQSAGGAVVTGGDGDIARPDKFKGQLVVQGAGLSGHVNVISVNGTFYAQLPLINHYVTIDPSRYGFGDPGQLIDRQHGLSSLLTSAENARDQGETRVNGEVVRHVHAVIPGSAVAKVLTAADTSARFTGDFFIAPSSNEARQVALTGPFVQNGHDSTYTLTLTRYGEHVDITAPTGEK